MSTKVRYITKGKEYRRSEYQMKQILIATHGKMASGIRYTAELIVGKMDEITTIDAYVTPEDNVEKKFDDIAEGNTEWNKWMKKFDQSFEPEVDKVINARSEHKAGERSLGVDPKSGRPVFVKIGRFGPVAQIGSAEDKEKPLFAQLPADKSIETITLNEAIELFKLPREVGEYEGTPVTIGAGRFGPYVLHNKKYVSIPKDEDPMNLTLERAIELIREKRESEQKRHIKVFDEDTKLELLNGRYGPYIAYDGKNYRIPKNKQTHVEELSYEECMNIIKEAPEPKASRRK